MLGKAIFKLSDISGLFSTALMDIILFKPSIVKCLPGSIKFITCLTSR